MNSISKFNGILTARVQKWAEENNVLDESQAGFRRGFSTIDNIFFLHAMVLSTFVDQGVDFTVCLLISNVL